MGFELSLYKKNSNFIYNQFDPSYYGIILPSNDTLERDIVYTLYNYILWVYDTLPERDKKFLCVYLVMAMYFYKEQLQPIINKISKNGVLTDEQRKKTIADQVSMSSMVYNKWHNPPLLHGTPYYEARINELKLMLKK